MKLKYIKVRYVSHPEAEKNGNTIRATAQALGLANITMCNLEKRIKQLV